MPATAELGKIPAVDLAYAINRLIQEGKISLADPDALPQNDRLASRRSNANWRRSRQATLPPR